MNAHVVQRAPAHRRTAGLLTLVDSDSDSDSGSVDENGTARPAPAVTVVIPTKDEAGNITELVRRLDLALGGVTAELIFADDSDDATPERILEVAARSSRSIRLLHRARNARAGGLGGAVVAGFRAARAPWVIVMDGDLQHPPEAVPEILAAGREATVDLVVATRYSGTGTAQGLGGTTRVTVSAACTRLAKLAFPRRLRGVTDPMSGFFAIRLAAVDIEELRPAGYKILLEILACTRIRTAREVPFSFQRRFSGESKATLGQGLTFGRRLLSLRLVAWYNIGAPARRSPRRAG